MSIIVLAIAFISVCKAHRAIMTHRHRKALAKVRRVP